MTSKTVESLMTSYTRSRSLLSSSKQHSLFFLLSTLAAFCQVGNLQLRKTTRPSETGLRARVLTVSLV